MTGAQAASCIAVKILVEQYEILPVIELSVLRFLAVTSAFAIYELKEFNEPLLDLVGDLGQIAEMPRSRRALNLKRIAIELVIGA